MLVIDQSAIIMAGFQLRGYFVLKDIFPVPAFRDNYLWTFVDGDSVCACVVDPGDAEPVIEYLESRQLRLSHILITHHHADHTGGLDTLSKRYAPQVYGPANSRIQGITTALGDGDSFELFGTTMEVLTVPGHTLDHIAYYAASPGDIDAPALFCGDTLFAAGCGRLFEGDPAMMYASLQKLARFEGKTRVYCTHEYTLNNLRFASAVEPGNQAIQNRVRMESAKREAGTPTLPSTLELELSTNPFLRCEDSSLAQIAEVKAGHPLQGAVEVFATLRQWKDSF